jgi:4-hydroxyphenylpyruvate dioxygenase
LLGPVQHVGFACDDIFATVFAMRSAGAAFLTILDNYDEGIDSRYELDRSSWGR